jgi:hypothetical protein
MNPTLKAVMLTAAVLLFLLAAFRAVRTGRVLALIDLVALGLAFWVAVACWEAWLAT